MFTSNQARNRLVATTDHILTLRCIIAFLLIVIIALWIRNGHLQETRRLYIPPDLTQGLVTDFSEVPAPTVYTFGYYIFQQLHRWKHNGEEDYPKQIFSLQGFFTPGCIATLKEDMNEKQKNGELRQRVRTIEEILGQGYQRNRVKIESNSSWLIWLDVRVDETIGGHPVKEVLLRYPLRIVRFDVDKQVNPWGLAIACDEGLHPKTLTEDDLGKSLSTKPIIPFGRTPMIRLITLIFVCLTIYCQANTNPSSELPERVVWDHRAIPVHIQTGQERTVHFPEAVRYWMPDHLSLKLTALSANGVLYLQGPSAV